MPKSSKLISYTTTYSDFRFKHGNKLKLIRSMVGSFNIDEN